MSLRTIAILVTACLIVVSSVRADENVEPLIRMHFETHISELNRYERLATYGQSITKNRPSQSTIDQEVAFYRNSPASDFFHKPSDGLCELCQNLLIHSPETGHELLQKLIQMPLDREGARRYLPIAMMVTGTRGEELAIKQLESKDPAVVNYWAASLSIYAICEESVAPLSAKIRSVESSETKSRLFHALVQIGGPKGEQIVDETINSTKDDLVLSSAIFAYTELKGWHGLRSIRNCSTLGPRSEKAKNDAIKWLAGSTSEMSPFGEDVENDEQFSDRFWDLDSPAMNWIRTSGVFELDKSGMVKLVRKPSDEERKEMFRTLIDSGGFGLMAIKGDVFQMIHANDLPMLLELHRVNWYSPNEFSRSQMQTIRILIRKARRTVPKT